MLLKLVTGNGERGTGNGEPGTGVWERVYSGNPPKNWTWRTKEKKREQLGEMGGSVTVVNFSFYWLCLRVQYGMEINKGWNSARGENRIGIITCYPKRSVQNADCRPGTKCRLGTKCRQRIKTVFRLIRDSMSSTNIPSVTQSLFRGHLSPTLALLWNIPCSFLHTFCL